jgi:hypothetical protein
MTPHVLDDFYPELLPKNVDSFKSRQYPLADNCAYPLNSKDISFLALLAKSFLTQSDDPTHPQNRTHKKTCPWVKSELDRA